MTLLLNRITLAPGEAIFLGPGNLHAYLQGAGVEVMGASDNVVRGGLTPKHVDVHELLAVLRIEPLPEPDGSPIEVDPGRWCYDTPDTPFRLWRWDIDGESPAHGHGARAAAVRRRLDVACSIRDRSPTWRPDERITLDRNGHRVPRRGGRAVDAQRRRSTTSMRASTCGDWTERVTRHPTADVADR